MKRTLFLFGILLFASIVFAAPSDVDITGAYKTSGTTRISATGVGTFASGTTINSLSICLSDGTNCPATGGSGVGNNSGWFNSTTLVWLANNATNLSVGYVNSIPALFVDTKNGRIGVNASSPNVHLQVGGDANITGSLYLNGSLVFGGTGTGNAAHGNLTGVGTSGTIPLWTDTTQIGNSIMTQTGTLITITGSLNLTAMLRVNTNLTIANAATANSTKEVWLDSQGETVAERYWNGTALVLNVT